MPTVKFATGPSDPRYEGMIDTLFNNTPGLGKSGKYWKNLLGRISSGEDYSSFGEFNPIREQAASERRSVGDNYLYGGNALIAGAGGEQANILNRMRDTAMDRIGEREGMNITRAASDLRGEAAGGLQRSIESRNQLQQQGRLAALGARGNYYSQRYQPYQTKSLWDKFMDVGNLVVGGASAAAGFRK